MCNSIIKQFNAGENISAQCGSTNPIFHLHYKDGLAIAMILLTLALTPIIIFSSFENEYKNAKAFYALILYGFCHGRNILSVRRSFILHLLGTFIPYLFHCLIWGNGDVEERKKTVVKFLSTPSGIFIYANCLCLFIPTSRKFFIRRFIKLSATEQLWIFLAFFLAYAIKIPLIPFHTWQANVYQKRLQCTMLLSGIMLKMGLYSIRWQLPIAHLQLRVHVYLHQFRLQDYGSIRFRQKT
jgi:NADH-quinone oxidoreductase subunit M